MLVALMYGFFAASWTAGNGHGNGRSSHLPGLIKWEARIKSPVLDVRLFLENRVYAFSNLAALISYSATFAVTFLLSLYLQYIKGLEPDQAGLVLVAQPW